MSYPLSTVINKERKSSKKKERLLLTECYISKSLRMLHFKICLTQHSKVLDFLFS